MLCSTKKYEEEFNHLLNRCQIDKNLVEKELKFVKETLEDDTNLTENRKENPLGRTEYLARDFFAIAAKNYLAEKNIESFKQYMYIGGKLILMAAEQRNLLQFDRRGVFYMLASNNQDLLNFVTKYSDTLTYHPNYKYKKSYSDTIHLIKTILSAFLGKWDDVIEKCNTYFQNMPTSGYENTVSVEYDFLKALAEKNVEKMKESVEKMLEPKIARKLVHNKDPKFRFWLQLYAVIYLKIALYHGYDFGIDRDICPKELIDNTPAKEYPEYDFMYKFDLKTITLEEWKAWIYKYHKNPNDLERYEREGYFI